MKILFIQLPLIDHGYNYIQGNVAYAPAALACYIRKNSSTGIQAEILPSVIMDFCSDSVIIKRVEEEGADIACFTCYLWNVERCLAISQSIKTKNKAIKIIFGGPEINTGSFVFSSPHDFVDYFVIGEGEWFFDRLLCGSDLEKYSCSLNGNNVVVQPSSGLIPAERIVEPWTGGCLELMPDGSTFLELVRGCPYKCSYCYYSKNSPGMRTLDTDVLLNALKRDPCLKELYIMCPTLNRAKNFHDILRMLAAENPGVRLHSEMRTDGIDPGTARLMARAGFKSLEVGLQSMNRESLDAVGRKSDPLKEIQGMMHLKEAGIELKIGVIPGLPRETPGTFMELIDLLVEKGFEENIEIYPLMILPGTEILEMAKGENISFMKSPPYYYNSGWGMTFDEIKKISLYAEESTGYTHVLPRLPDFSYSEDGSYYRGASFDGDSSSAWDFSRYREHVQTSVFNFHIRLVREKNFYDNFNRFVSGTGESELYNLIFTCEFVLDEGLIIEIIMKHESDNLFRRQNVLNEWKDGLRFMLYQISDDLGTFMRMKEAYSVISPILYIAGGTSGLMEQLDPEHDFILLKRGAYSSIKKPLIGAYGEFPESVAFEDEMERRDFFKSVGMEYTDIPVRFKLANFLSK